MRYGLAATAAALILKIALGALPNGLPTTLVGGETSNGRIVATSLGEGEVCRNGRPRRKDSDCD